MKQFQMPTIEEELKLSEIKPNPCFYEVNRGGKKIICFGLQHTSDENNPQFKEIYKIIENFNPNCVVLELPENVIPRIKSKENLVARFKEIAIIYNKLAPEVHIAGGDLDGKTLFDQMVLKDKYSKADLFMVYFLKQVEIALVKSDRDVNEVISEEIKKANIPENEKAKFLDRLNKYVLELTGKSLDQLKRGDKIAPIPIENKSILNTIVREESELRDSNMINVIEDCIKKFDRVLFFAGRNHILRQERYWIEDM